MELDLTGPLREDAYRILSGLVTPRPIAPSATDPTFNPTWHVTVIPKFCCSQRRVGDGVTGGPLISLAASTAFARTSASELGQYANTPSPMNLSITAPRGFKIASQSAYHSRSIAATSSAVSCAEIAVKSRKSPTKSVAFTVFTGIASV